MPADAISILGCGWLGLPLAKDLIARGFTVLGSTTSQEKLSVLQNFGIRPFLIEFKPQLQGNEAGAFFCSRVLFLNIPFERHLEDPHFYKKQISSVLESARTGAVEFVIFAGSTAVYPEALEKATEETPFRPDNPRAQVLWDVEQMLLSDLKVKATVVRLGGLYGPGRPLGRFLAGKKGLSGGSKPVNLVHQNDAVRAVTEIISRDVGGEILNVVTDGHPTRKDLYTAAARHTGLESPQFLAESPGRYKIVTNQKIKERLGFTFTHPDPLEFNELEG